MSGGMSITKRRKAIRRASLALQGLGEALWQANGPELGELMAIVDRLREHAEAARVAVLIEAVERGESPSGTSGAHAWLLEWAPSFRSGGSAAMVKVLDAVRLDRYAGLRRAVLEARVPVHHAACVVDEFERIGHRLHPEAHGPVIDTLVELAETGRPRDIRAIRRHLVARYGYEGEFQADQDRLRERRALSQPMDDGTGLYEYRLLADTEAMTAIEAAVGPLAAPCPVEGEPDRRPSSQRRADALLAVLRRGVASAEGVGTTTKAQLVVSMSLADLTSGSYAGTVVGSTQDGTLLGPETVRRLACDARLVPAVLGSRGELLDLGRAVRLFSEGQTRALWLRDRGCTFPGCSVPASWSDAHHLRHWADGGSTDLANGALLCGRHHDRVHARGYHGEVTNEEVAWDVTPGSYDHWLRREEAPAGYQRAGPNLGKGTGAPPVREFDVWGQRATAPVEPSPPAWRP